MGSRDYQNSTRRLLDVLSARRPKPALDPNEICCEIYNPGPEDITFTNYHRARDRQHYLGKPPEYWMRFICKVGEWVFLPHQYYIGTVPSGSKEIRVVKNFGDMIGVGNKLPSRPESKKTRFCV